MPKDYFQDITPPPGSGGHSAPPPPAHKAPSPENGNGFERTIRNIPINPRRHSQAEPLGTHSSAPVAGATPRPARPSFSDSPRIGVKKYLIGGAAVLALIVIAIFTFAAFRGTSVVIKPRTHTIVLTEDVALAAYPMTDKNVPPGSLVYDIAYNTYDAEQVVPAVGFEEVQEYARGVVTIYNEYSNTPVRLIKNTRFEGPSGLIFRVRDSVVVPGKKGENPGTVTATIYADQPGDKYNTAPVDKFTVPGLKNTSNDMFNKVYARSVVAFTGGFVGERPKVAEADLEKSRRALRAGLEERARTEAAKINQPGIVVFPQLMNITFEALQPEKGADGQVRVRERASINIPAFQEALFAKVLATATRADLGESVVHFKDMTALALRKVTTEDKPEGAVIDLVASGSATLIWEVDLQALAQALAGTTKDSFQNITAGFPGVEEANAYIRPMWKRAFPADPADISIILNESQASAE